MHTQHTALRTQNLISQDSCPNCERPIQSDNVKTHTREDGIIVMTFACPACRKIEHRHFYRTLGGQLQPMTPEEIARDREEPINRAKAISAEIARNEVILDELRGQLRETLDELDEQTRAELDGQSDPAPSTQHPALSTPPDRPVHTGCCQHCGSSWCHSLVTGHATDCNNYGAIPDNQHDAGGEA